MAEQSTTLLPLYKGWDAYQELLLKTLEPLSSDQLALRTAPHLRSIGENAAHIAGTRAGWLYYVLKRGGEPMVSLSQRNANDQPARSAAELISDLKTSFQAIQETLTTWTIDDLGEEVQDTNEQGEIITLTRQWVIWHLIEHDVHHGGEISFTLGMHGLTGMDI